MTTKSRPTTPRTSRRHAEKPQRTYSGITRIYPHDAKTRTKTTSQESCDRLSETVEEKPLFPTTSVCTKHGIKATSTDLPHSHCRTIQPTTGTDCLPLFSMQRYWTYTPPMLRISMSLLSSLRPRAYPKRLSRTSTTRTSPSPGSQTVRLRRLYRGPLLCRRRRWESRRRMLKHIETHANHYAFLF